MNANCRTDALREPDVPAGFASKHKYRDGGSAGQKLNDLLALRACVRY
jgi:hypothetical protein